GLVVLFTLVAFIGMSSAEAAILPVTICNDNGTQLRSQITAAMPGDTIALPACAITLTAAGGPIVLEKTLTLVGSGPAQTILDGGKVTGVLSVDNATAAVVIIGITLQHGNLMSGPGGGGINLNSGSLVLDHSVVSSNNAGVGGFGGGIFASPGTVLTL